MRLEGRVAVVTGSASGIGAACSARFIDEGAVVVGIDLAGADHVADVRDEGALAAAMQAVAEEYGRLDVLVNAAGVTGGGPVHLLDAAEWERVIGINLTGTYLACKAALAVMVPQRSGSIVNLASVEGLQGMDVIAPYNASKGGVILLTRQMAVDYGRIGIRVNCLCPGFIETPMTATIRAEGMEVLGDRIRDAHLLGRFGLPDEVAAAAAFLASDDASFVHGHALVVDGGLTAGHRYGISDALGLV